ncbi:hypothetical protein ACFS6H_09800 [Terrimonas rubra]|uniref:PH domain-containing protein n=1 Tax=Terrimonas rubra TaxID=1035890 RepID=A0ABW6A6X1_9BACT
MDTKQLDGKRVFWSNKWDKLWLLIIPTIFLFDIFCSNRYSSFWFWTILIGAAVFIIYVLYHMFYPKFAWVDTKSKDGKLIQQKAFDLRYNDTGVFQYVHTGFYFSDKDQTIFVAWADIKSIFAFKRDLMTVDELNIEVFLKNDTRIRLTEEIDGWFQFIIKLKEVFPNIDKEFDTKLIFPAFETNLTLVYNSKNKTLSELINQYYEQYGR